jgi:hypothetical protein
MEFIMTFSSMEMCNLLKLTHMYEDLQLGFFPASENVEQAQQDGIRYGFQ